jgi:hypothetical protein
MTKRIISQTFSVGLDRLERLSDVAARTRVIRSSLLREAIDVVLARCDEPTTDPDVRGAALLPERPEPTPDGSAPVPEVGRGESTRPRNLLLLRNTQRADPNGCPRSCPQPRRPAPRTAVPLGPDRRLVVPRLTSAPRWPSFAFADPPVLCDDREVLP